MLFRTNLSQVIKKRIISNMVSSNSFLADFQKFIMQGNVVDLAVAVIMGGAFGKIVESLVVDIVTPAILSPAMTALNVKNLEELSINGILYGKFLAAVINFVIISFAIFLMIRALEKAKRLRKRQEAIAQETAPDPTVVLQERMIESMDRLSRSMENR